MEYFSSPTAQSIQYDRLPKNVRYNYPDDHPTWPSEAAGINVAELKEI